MLQPSQLFIIKFGYIIILLASFTATVRENESTFDSNLGSNFPIQPTVISSTSNIKKYPDSAIPTLESTIVESTSFDARNIIASNTGVPKSDVGPTIAISTSTNVSQPLVSKNLSGSAYTNSETTTLTVESTIFHSNVNSSTSNVVTSTSGKVCAKLPISGNLKVVPSAPIPSFIPIKGIESPSVHLPTSTYRGTKLNSFAQAALSAPVLQKYLNYKISGLDAAVVFFDHVYNSLQYFGAPHYASNANEIFQAVASIDVLTLPLYFQATGNAIQKFMLLKGIEISPVYSENYASYVEDSVLSFNIDGPVSLYQALLNGFSNFISSLGFCDGKDADNLSFLFSSELLSL